PRPHMHCTPSPPYSPLLHPLSTTVPARPSSMASPPPTTSPPALPPQERCSRWHSCLPTRRPTPTRQQSRDRSARPPPPRRVPEPDRQVPQHMSSSVARGAA